MSLRIYIVSSTDDHQCPSPSPFGISKEHIVLFQNKLKWFANTESVRWSITISIGKGKNSLYRLPHSAYLSMLFSLFDILFTINPVLIINSTNTYRLNIPFRKSLSLSRSSGGIIKSAEGIILNPNTNNNNNNNNNNNENNTFQDEIFGFESLPIEILVSIFNYIPTWKGLLRVGRVCKYWRLATEEIRLPVPALKPSTLWNIQFR